MCFKSTDFAYDYFTIVKTLTFIILIYFKKNIYLLNGMSFNTVN